AYLMPFGLFLFIFSQSLMLAMQFSQSFITVAALSGSLRETNRSLNRFVPHEFLEYLGRKSIVDVRLGDQILSGMTVMFIDIRNFATISEKMQPQEVINFLNSYLSLITPVIRDHKGFIDKYIGDAVMALFPDNTEFALDAAIAVQKLIRLYSAEHAHEPGFPIRVGIGLHSGNLMLCTIGDESRLDTTVISDAVNLASRVECLTKVYGANILVSENLFLSLPDRNKYRYRYLDKVKVKGKAEAVTIIEILDGLSSSMIELKLKTREDFETAVKYYQNKQIPVANNIFQKVLWTNPRDAAAQLFINRCADRRQGKELDEWDGIEIMDSK
ncbi:MAG: adenylate/guanylate cyclase domain-containing protein, partial [Spirochaetota bacterium]